MSFPTDAMIPIIRQLHDADGHRARARILLVMPDTILLKHAETVDGACRRAGFQAGSEFVLRRVAMMRAVRGGDGLPPAPLARDFEEFRSAFAAFASGETADG
jgi:hypothetical protein